jgi:predicted nucleotide-binding protein
MAKRRGGSPEWIEPTLPPEQAAALFKELLAEADEIARLPYDDPQVDPWIDHVHKTTLRAFGNRYGHEHTLYSARVNTREHFGPYGGGASPADLQRAHEGTVRNYRAVMERFIKELDGLSRPRGSAVGHAREERQSNTVFIVHGRDDAAKNELALIIGRLGLRPIILHEQPNRGRTLIEKLEAHMENGYSFILLTPDDEGRLNSPGESLRPRARQNVILELGLFIGALSRAKVACLYSGNVELPSDLGGLALMPFNKSVSERALDIVNELKAAGFDVSADRLRG